VAGSFNLFSILCKKHRAGERKGKVTSSPKFDFYAAIGSLKSK